MGQAVQRGGGANLHGQRRCCVYRLAVPLLQQQEQSGRALGQQGLAVAPFSREAANRLAQTVAGRRNSGTASVSHPLPGYQPDELIKPANMLLY